MAASSAHSGVSTSWLSDRLIVTIQGDLDQPVRDRLQGEVLDELQQRGVHLAVFDLSAVDVIDLDDFAALRALLTMVKLLGAQPVLIGLQPGVVAFLASAGADTTDIITARGLPDVDRALTGLSAS